MFSKRYLSNPLLASTSHILCTPLLSMHANNALCRSKLLHLLHWPCFSRVCVSALVFAYFSVSCGNLHLHLYLNRFNLPVSFWIQTLSLQLLIIPLSSTYSEDLLSICSILLSKSLIKMLNRALCHSTRDRALCWRQFTNQYPLGSFIHLTVVNSSNSPIV